MIWRTRFSSLTVSTRPQNETVSSKCPALQQWRRDPEAARSRVEHRRAKVQRNLARRLYGANGQSPENASWAISTTGASASRLIEIGLACQLASLPTSSSTCFTAAGSRSSGNRQRYAASQQ